MNHGGQAGATVPKGFIAWLERKQQKERKKAGSTV